MKESPRIFLATSKNDSLVATFLHSAISGGAATSLEDTLLSGRGASKVVACHLSRLVDHYQRHDTALSQSPSRRSAPGTGKYRKIELSHQYTDRCR